MTVHRFIIIKIYDKLIYAALQGAQIEGTSVQIFRGYYKREHSLIKPYQGCITAYTISH